MITILQALAQFFTITNLIAAEVKVDLIREKVLNIFPLETETEREEDRCRFVGQGILFHCSAAERCSLDLIPLSRVLHKPDANSSASSSCSPANSLPLVLLLFLLLVLRPMLQGWGVVGGGGALAPPVCDRERESRR